ncbi:hypothetical protein [Gorillibacterium sp. sgz5001074]|uniref:hypothetical protein n=1 Tax=Gorillibacterium sp. sgz5001074 TaxID=3446695 RepID=UPI003F66A77B
MDVWGSTMVILLFFAGCWVLGLRALKKDGRMREKLGFTFFLGWCVYLFLSKRLGMPPFTPQTANEWLFLPIGRWVESIVIGNVK